MSSIGILLTNTGTPDKPTNFAVMRYLRAFLSDKRIVHLPRFIWLPILYGLILPFRPFKTTKLYKKVWTPQGSPLRVSMNSLSVLVEQALNDASTQHRYHVEIGMNYGSPSILQGLKALRDRQVDRIITLPLFPQFSHTTTSSTMDRVKAAASKLKLTSTIFCILQYADNPEYIKCLADSVRDAWKKQEKPRHLLISFHGIPERFVKEGDPYQSQCERTATLLAEALQLTPDLWTLCYQSQFGYDKWLKPSTQALLTTLPATQITHCNIICPGFPVDCLETLEEIAILGQETFKQAGGKALDYIHALNESEEHANMLADMIISRHEGNHIHTVLWDV